MYLRASSPVSMAILKCVHPPIMILWRLIPQRVGADVFFMVLYMVSMTFPRLLLAMPIALRLSSLLKSIHASCSVVYALLSCPWKKAELAALTSMCSRSNIERTWATSLDLLLKSGNSVLNSELDGSEEELDTERVDTPLVNRHFCWSLTD